MCDIIFSVAWECGDRDCKAQWHKANYWTQHDGYSVDNYSDGDHEDIEEKDLPSLDEVNRSWREYAAYVAKHGIDPLDEYYVKRTAKVRERWQFKVNNSIIGPVLVRARRAGRTVTAATLPDHVREYLQLDKGNRKLGDFANWDSLIAVQANIRPMVWWTIHIEHDKPRDLARVTSELKRAARKAMENKP